MKNNKVKNIFNNIIILILIIAPFSIILNVKADSGWDSDYDSGSWSSSDSSWSSSDSSWSSSSWDDDYGTTYTEYNSSGSPSLLFIIIVIIIIIILSSRKNNISNTTSNYTDISEELLKKYLPNTSLNELKKDITDKFIAIQEAWMEFDYDKLRTLCTDELYNSYIAQLDVLKIKNNKNIMKEFGNITIKITNIKEENGNLSISVNMIVSFYDYVVDKDNKVVRGTDKNKITNNYIMTFIKAYTNESEKDHCPNCGAPINNNASQNCEYCNSPIVKSSSDFVLSKKTNINK